MNIRHTPSSVAAPFGPYSHAVEVPEGSRLLYISGEVGVLPDGTVPQGIEAQAEACWQNIIAILADAGWKYLSASFWDAQDVEGEMEADLWW